MKKRSLFVAVVMLVVSAMVLTSATYAWFATTGSLTVQSFSASVENTSGGLVISADNSNWTNTLTYADYNYTNNTNSLIGTYTNGTYAGGTFTPVSGTVGSAGVSFVGGRLAGATFTGEAATTGSYLKVTTYAKTLNGVTGTLTITPNFTTASDFVYYAIFVKDSGGNVVTNGTYTLAKQADGYSPISSSSGTCTDANTDGVIQSAEGSAGTVTVSSTSVSAVATSAQAISVSMTASLTAVTIDVYMWAEGQDANCTGSVTTANSTSAMTLSFVANS